MKEGDILENRYQIIREIGFGGTGVIYLAYHRTLQKYCVVKKIKDRFVGSTNVRGEADILKRLRHMYLPQVYDFVQIGTAVYTVMDYIDGMDLQQYIDRGITFDEKQLIIWMKQLCQVLDYLHSQKPPILHSDIKPGNLMITKEGNICLIDFNISLSGETENRLLGVSPWYAAPEQYTCLQISLGQIPEKKIHLDARMDIYSAAAVFYRLMCGNLPSPEKENVPLRCYNLPYSAGFCAVLDRAMSYAPGKRYPSAKAMEKALENVEKMHPQYRLLTGAQVLVGLSSAIMALAGVLMIYYGIFLNRQEDWQSAWELFYDKVTEEDGEAVIRQGNTLLNREEYQRFIDEKTRQEICYAIGSAYFNEELYAEAAAYLEEAAQDSDNTTYLCDYAVALAKNQQLSRAERVMEEAEKNHLGSAEVLLIRAQIAVEAGDDEEAFACLEKLTARDAGKDLLLRAYLLEAELYRQEGAIDQELQAYQTAALYDTGKRVLRKYGEALCRAADAAPDETKAREYYVEAQACYEKLCEETYVSDDDWLNLAIVELSLGAYQESREHLLTLVDSDDYRVYMLLCETYLLDGVKIDERTAQAREMRQYYTKAEAAYQNQPRDEDMEELIYLFSGYRK